LSGLIDEGQKGDFSREREEKVPRRLPLPEDGTTEHSEEDPR
jgi:hypothetical protein